MFETAAELTALDELLTRSLRSAGPHLRSIVTEGERTLDAAETARVLTGMRTLSLATVTSSHEPRISGVDGHFLHGRWVFTTAASAVKARHLRARPQVSAAHLVGDDLGIFVHGRVEHLDIDHPDFAAVEQHLVGHYGSSPSSWADAIVYARIEPHWMVSYAYEKQRVLAEADTC
ncbi:MAG: pyridoxamine 5'-phosphate oxidase family protein [Nocardioidaceae bacterium]|nr:pyridoxamine 5'-phosphate oxidase family protein [Nocardioidaceae bacterium]